MHGANRLGGNGVANSTVFGAVAGDVMAAWVAQGRIPGSGPWLPWNRPSRDANPRSRKPTARSNPLRERLYDVMWEKVGIIRGEAGLRAALSELNALENELNDTGIADANRAFNLTWHDWLNLKSLMQTSRVIAEAALARTDSRGAHFREDFPEAGPLEQFRLYEPASWTASRTESQIASPSRSRACGPGESRSAGRRPSAPACRSSRR